jgi:phosphatidylglycerophosphatase A
MSETSEPVSTLRKPRISYFFATACGLGYLKPGPGTWGSLAGVGISVLLVWNVARKSAPDFGTTASVWTFNGTPIYLDYIIAVLVAVLGVYVSSKVERHYGKSDPQFVVIDEVSGQLIALSFPFTLLNWKSWLLGFILFRVFDIWKPFPARQAESLHGGWGIMADDWIAGIYAGLVLWGVQATGILK